MDEFDTVQADAAPEFTASEPEQPEKGFPSFRYGPDGQSGVFQSSDEVPEGWQDHPSKVPGATDPSKVEANPRRPGKAEIMKDLKRLNVTFSALESGSGLHAKLLAARAGTGIAPEKPAKAPQTPKAAPKVRRKRRGKKAAHKAPAKPTNAHEAKN